MMLSKNTRRNFLTNLAILTAGSVVAGSQASLFSSAEKNNLMGQWKKLLAYSNGRSVDCPAALLHSDIAVTKGLIHKRGQMVLLENEGLLAQPTWIYNARKNDRPIEVIIEIYDHSSYQKMITLNRYELNALLQVQQNYTEEKVLLTSLFKKGNEASHRLKTVTTIRDHKHHQSISYMRRDELLIKEKTILNV